MILQIAVLLANGMVHESFQFLRRRWSSGLAQDSARDKQILLYYFFNRCDALGKLVRGDPLVMSCLFY